MHCEVYRYLITVVGIKAPSFIFLYSIYIYFMIKSVFHCFCFLYFLLFYYYFYYFLVYFLVNMISQPPTVHFLTFLTHCLGRHYPARPDIS